jgi:hypothetical protein
MNRKSMHHRLTEILGFMVGRCQTALQYMISFDLNAFEGRSGEFLRPSSCCQCNRLSEQPTCHPCASTYRTFFVPIARCTCSGSSNMGEERFSSGIEHNAMMVWNPLGWVASVAEVLKWPAGAQEAGNKPRYRPGMSSTRPSRCSSPSFKPDPTPCEEHWLVGFAVDVVKSSAGIFQRRGDKCTEEM